MKEQINKRAEIQWIAYCTDCQVELERCPNGLFAEGAARHHIHYTGDKDHKVIIGYEIHGEKK